MATAAILSDQYTDGNLLLDAAASGAGLGLF